MKEIHYSVLGVLGVSNAPMTAKEIAKKLRTNSIFVHSALMFLKDVGLVSSARKSGWESVWSANENAYV